MKWLYIIMKTAGAIAIGSKNSIRYRGYVYDSETEMYYLQSRYYDPETGAIGFQASTQHRQTVLMSENI